MLALCDAPCGETGTRAPVLHDSPKFRSFDVASANRRAGWAGVTEACRIMAGKTIRLLQIVYGADFERIILAGGCGPLATVLRALLIFF